MNKLKYIHMIHNKKELTPNTWNNTNRSLKYTEWKNPGPSKMHSIRPPLDKILENAN